MARSRKAQDQEASHFSFCTKGRPAIVGSFVRKKEGKVMETSIPGKPSTSRGGNTERDSMSSVLPNRLRYQYGATILTL